MDRSNTCPACGQAKIDVRPALIAPFIARYVLESGAVPSTVCRCEACELLYFGRPYSDAEVARLYKNYRGPRYQSERQQFEPLYTAEFNASFGSEAGIEPRREVYRSFLAAHSDEVRTVLDYAGDRGQMMRGGPGQEHSVFEISGAPADDGVTAIRDLAALEGRVFDLVLLCGVVEHFSWPLEQVREVTRFVRPGGLLYVEVPDEVFAIRWIPKGELYRTYLAWIVRRPLFLRAAEFYTAVGLHRFGLIPPLGVAEQHEHLNFFTVKALSALLEHAGLALLACHIGGDSVVALCRRPDV